MKNVRVKVERHTLEQKEANNSAKDNEFEQDTEEVGDVEDYGN